VAVLEASSVVGIDENKIRVGGRIKAADVEAIFEDQAAVWREVTGNDAQNAPGSSQATPHIHDGTNGVVIPIPLATWTPYASLGRPSDGVTGEGYAKLVYAPFFAPDGVDRVRVVIRTRNPVDLLPWLHVSTESAPGTYVSGPTVFTVEGGILPGGYFSAHADVATTAGAFNLLRIEAWDGYHTPDGVGVMPALRDLATVTVLPTTARPGPLPTSWRPTPTTRTDAIVPDDRYPKDTGTNYPFTSIESGMVSENRALSSYLTVSGLANAALTYEVLTGRPASMLANTGSRPAGSARYIGHCHAGGDNTDLDESGAEMDQPLLSVSYGVGRAWEGASDTTDQVHSGAGTWNGNIHAPRAPSHKPATWDTIAHHRFRLPRASTVTGGSSKLSMCVLCFNNTGNPADVGGTVLSEGGSAIGSRQTYGTISDSSSHQMVTISNFEQGATTDAVRRILKVDVEADSSRVTAPFLIYGVAFAYEGAA